MILAECTLGVCEVGTGRVFCIHCDTSDRIQPAQRPRNRRFAGNLPSNARPQKYHLGRRTSLATSRAVRSWSNGGNRSSRNGEIATLGIEDANSVRGLPAEFWIFINDLQVWFRSFRVKLSLMRIMHENRQHFISKLRGLFSETEVCKFARKARLSKGYFTVLEEALWPSEDVDQSSSW